MLNRFVVLGKPRLFTRTQKWGQVQIRTHRENGACVHISQHVRENKRSFASYMRPDNRLYYPCKPIEYL